MSGHLASSQDHLEKAQQLIQEMRRSRKTKKSTPNERKHDVCTKLLEGIGVTATMENSIVGSFGMKAHGMEDHGGIFQVPSTPPSVESLATALDNAIKYLCTIMDEEKTLASIGATFNAVASFCVAESAPISVVTANAGDSFTVLLKRKISTSTFEDPILLNWPHHTLDPAEKERILACNPPDEKAFVFERGRLGGELLPSRGLGNFKYDGDSQHFDVIWQGYRSSPIKGFSHTPDLTHIDLPRSPDHEPDHEYYVLNFSDGLTYLLDALPDLLKNYTGGFSDLKNFADYLVQQSAFYPENYPDDCLLNIIPIHRLEPKHGTYVAFVADGHGGETASRMAKEHFEASLNRACQEAPHTEIPIENNVDPFPALGSPLEVAHRGKKPFKKQHQSRASAATAFLRNDLSERGCDKENAATPPSANLS